MTNRTQRTGADMGDELTLDLDGLHPSGDPHPGQAALGTLPLPGATPGTVQHRLETIQLVNWGGFEGHVVIPIDRIPRSCRAPPARVNPPLRTPGWPCCSRPTHRSTAPPTTRCGGGRDPVCSETYSPTCESDRHHRGRPRAGQGQGAARREAGHLGSGRGHVPRRSCRRFTRFAPTTSRLGHNAQATSSTACSPPKVN